MNISDYIIDYYKDKERINFELIVSSLNKRKEKFIKDANKVHDNKYIYENLEFINSHKKIKIKCGKHGEFEQKPYSHLNGAGCPICGLENRIKAQTKTLEKFIEQANIIHHNRYDYSKSIYKTDKIKLIIICSIHGDFKMRPNHHLKNGGCPKCSISKGEDRIYRLLKLWGVDFEHEKTFEGCEYKAPLRFDFYIPINNTCIEYDGEFHYIETDYSDLKITKLRDSIKNEYCKNNNINLIRIPYFNFDNIENILKENFYKYKNDKKSEIIEGSIDKFYSYNDCVNVLKKYKFKTSTEFYKWVNSDYYDTKIPKQPPVVYKREWVNWKTFLSHKRLTPIEIKASYLSYKDAKKWINDNIDIEDRKISRMIKMRRNGIIPKNIPIQAAEYHYNQMGDWISFSDYVSIK